MKILKPLFLTIFVLLFLLSALWVTLRLEPELVLNLRNYQIAKKLLSSDSIVINDENLHLNIQSVSFNKKNVEMSADRFCLSLSELDFCLDRFELKITFEFGLLMPKITSINLLKGHSPYFIIHSSSSQSSQENKSNGLLDGIPSWIKKLDFGEVDLLLPQFVIKNQNEEINLNVEFKNENKEDKTFWNIESKIKYKIDSRQYLSTSHLALISNKNKLFSPQSLNLNAKINLPGVKDYQILFNLEPRTESLEDFKFTFDSKGYFEGASLKLSINGETDFTQAVGDLGFDWKLKNALFDKLYSKGCHFELNSSIKVSCPIFAERVFEQKLSTFTVRSKAEYDFNNNLHAVFDLDSKKFDLFDLDGTLELTASRTETSMKWEPVVVADLNGKVSSFKKFARFLKSTSTEIYAPFDVLDGEIEFQSKGKIDFNKSTLPVQVKTSLSSKEQKVLTTSQGLVRLKRNELNDELQFIFDLDVNLDQVLLVLPSMSLSEPAKVTSDPRISEEPIDIQQTKMLNKNDKLQKSSLLAFNLRIKTPQGHPVLLKSNLTKKFIPVDIDLNIPAGDEIFGRISVLSVELELFNRNATLKHFDITFSKDSELEKISGLIEVKYTDYTIKILVLGTTLRPIVTLSSDPPLPQDALVSTLIFGQPVDALDDDQAVTVGQTRAALADQAIGLASLYFLASTPIERLNYNPATKKVSAKVRIGDGTSLHLGRTNGEEVSNEIGLRKRLTEHWIISTDYIHENKDSSDQGRASAFIEWVNRY